MARTIRKKQDLQQLKRKKQREKEVTAKEDKEADEDRIISVKLRTYSGGTTQEEKEVDAALVEEVEDGLIDDADDDLLADPMQVSYHVPLLPVHRLTVLYGCHHLNVVRIPIVRSVASVPS